MKPTTVINRYIEARNKDYTHDQAELFIRLYPYSYKINGIVKEKAALTTRQGE
jgi:hypothetical protein